MMNLECLPFCMRRKTSTLSRSWKYDDLHRASCACAARACMQNAAPELAESDLMKVAVLPHAVHGNAGKSVGVFLVIAA